MPHERYFVDAPLVGDVTIEGREHHHLAHVMRTQKGASIELVNGKGILASALVVAVSKRNSVVSIQQTHQEPPPKTEVIVVQAIPRLNRLDTIIEKGTELGMTELWLFPGKLSERKKLSESQLSRAKSVAIAAMKQCGRLYLPPILVKPPLLSWESIPAPAIFGDLDPQAPLLMDIWSKDTKLFFTGPEGGFTEEEITHLRSLGAQGAKLHQNILRTDTATITALSIIGHINCNVL